VSQLCPNIVEQEESRGVTSKVIGVELPEGIRISSSTVSVTYKLTVPSKKASGLGEIEEVGSKKDFMAEGSIKQ